MKRSCKLQVCIAGVLLGILFGPPSYAQVATPEEQVESSLPEGLSLNLNTSFFSQYIWRGQELSQDSLVMFPSLTVGYKGFYLNLWLDVDSDYKGDPDGAQLWEKDYVFYYSNAWSKVNYTLGYIYYDTMPLHNQELYVTLGLNVPLAPSFTIYREIELGESWYFNFALSHSFKMSPTFLSKLPEPCSLDVGGWVSYWDIGYGDDSSSTRRSLRRRPRKGFSSAEGSSDYDAMNDGNLWAGFTIPLNKHMSIMPKIQYSFPLSSEANDFLKDVSFDGHDSQFVYGGIILDITFP